MQDRQEKEIVDIRKYNNEITRETIMASKRLKKESICIPVVNRWIDISYTRELWWIGKYIKVCFEMMRNCATFTTDLTLAEYVLLREMP